MLLTNTNSKKIQQEESKTDLPQTDYELLLIIQGVSCYWNLSCSFTLNCPFMAGWLPNQCKHCEATLPTWSEFQLNYNFYSLLKTTTIKSWKKYRKRHLEKIRIVLVKRKPRCILVSERWCMNRILAFECCPLINFEMSLLTEESYMWPTGKLSFQAYQQIKQSISP